MTEKLKTCPLCGSKVIINISSWSDDMKQVVCPNCGASTLWGEDAVKRWNTRKKDKIKRCPLCNSRASSHEAYDGTWLVQCTACSLRGPFKHTRGEAIKAWNRRVE